MKDKKLLWRISVCPFCGKPVRGEEWLEGSHYCEGIRKALKDIKRLVEMTAKRESEACGKGKVKAKNGMF